MTANPSTDGLGVALNGSRRYRNGHKKPGPKPGGPKHSGMFKKGDPRINRAGPRKSVIIKTLEEKCREHADAALEFLVGLVNDPKASTKDRSLAARELLDRGFGRPVDRQAILQMNGQPGSAEPAEKLKDSALEAIISGALPTHDPADDHQVLDITPVLLNGSSPCAGHAPIEHDEVDD